MHAAAVVAAVHTRRSCCPAGAHPAFLLRVWQLVPGVEHFPVQLDRGVEGQSQRGCIRMYAAGFEACSRVGDARTKHTNLSLHQWRHPGMTEECTHLLVVEALDAVFTVELGQADLDVSLAKDVAEELADPVGSLRRQTTLERRVEHDVDEREVVRSSIAATARRVGAHTDVNVLAVVLAVQLRQEVALVNGPSRMGARSKAQSERRRGLLPLVHSRVVFAPRPDDGANDRDEYQHHHDRHAPSIAHQPAQRLMPRQLVVPARRTRRVDRRRTDVDRASPASRR